MYLYSVRYVGVFTAGLVLYRITADYWDMLSHLTQDYVCMLTLLFDSGVLKLHVSWH